MFFILANYTPMHRKVNTQSNMCLLRRNTWTYSKRMTIADRLDQSMKHFGYKSESALARASGVPQPTINRILSGKVKGPEVSTIKKLAAACGVSFNYLNEGIADILPKKTSSNSAAQFSSKEEINLDNNPEYPAIRRVKLKLSAGISGFSVELEDENHVPIVFGKYWYQSRGFKPENLIATKVRGDSMEPRLSHNDTVVINTADILPIDGDVFAVNYEGEPVIKRLVRDAGEWWLASDNPDQIRFKRKLCAGDACIIIGKIVHKQSEKI